MKFISVLTMSQCWKRIPGFTGVGVSTIYSVFFLAVYYIMLMAWAMFYFLSSFQNPLPWSSCRVTDEFCSNETFSTPSYKSPETFFWENRVLKISESLSEIGGMNWQIVACLALAWLICWGCVAKGVKDLFQINFYFTNRWKINFIISSENFVF